MTTFEDWLKLSGWESKHAESAIERFDGVDLGPYLQDEYRRYLAALDQLDPSVFDCHDVSALLNVIPTGDNCAEFLLPEPYRRLVAVQLRGWDCPATILDSHIVDRSTDARLAVLGNPYALPGVTRPLAVRYGNLYQLFPATSDNVLKIAIAL